MYNSFIWEAQISVECPKKVAKTGCQERHKRTHRDRCSQTVNATIWGGYAVMGGGDSATSVPLS